MYNDEIVNIYNRNLHEDFLLEMASVSSIYTGLPYDLWLDPAGRTRGNEHTYTPRLKVELEDGSMVPFLISDSPDIPDSVKKQGMVSFKNIQAIKEYVKAYKDILLAHFNRKINDREVLNLLNTLPESREMLDKLNNILNPYKIDYKWDVAKNSYVINITDKSNSIIETDYAQHDFQLLKALNDIGNKYNIKIS